MKQISIISDSLESENLGPENLVLHKAVSKKNGSETIDSIDSRSQNNAHIMAEVTQVLARHSININSFHAESFERWAVLLFTVDQYDKAVEVLRSETSFRLVTDDVILVRIEDKPGALAKLARQFSDIGISIRSMRIIQRGPNDSAVAISAQRSEALLALVKDILIC